MVDVLNGVVVVGVPYGNVIVEVLCCMMLAGEVVDVGGVVVEAGGVVGDGTP